ncbi:probable protein phosphatase 2C 66 [Dioscorea cayenensis subsp. rotundata]|uniref:protein-serine/threonine phosphatase n=1 Tax=Dioscorea cayennensis subsp. rotundata TaxID=55577 RepID=A0AB40CIK5_DIOCR|nr:probable protein phosphatase 2C 66 [Dioscorea cayenensis subsp. rotundata]
MGACLSTQSPAAAAAGTPPDGVASSRCVFGSKEEKRRKLKQKREKENGGLFERRLVAGSGVGREMSEEELHDTPGRMFLNGASEVACLFTQQGKKGTNQDAMIVWENFASRSDTIFCGVFDGHGPFGHMVAKKVRDSLPLKLCEQWRANSSSINSPQQNGSAHGSMNSVQIASIDDQWGESFDVDENGKLPEAFSSLKQSFLKAFKLMDIELKLHPSIDCFCSGTTAVTVLKQGHNLVIGNVGDSRAVMGTRDKDNKLVPVQLTVDLKPNLPREAARIQQCRGRVFALQDEPEVARVWLPNNDSPGLAMARAFGDFCLKDYGLISVPDISYRELTEKDEFVVLATDGIWDVLSNKDVVDIVSAAPSRSTAARALVDCAVRTWRLKFPTSKIDDCATVVLFLDVPFSSDQPEGCTSENPQIDSAPADSSISSLTKEETSNEEDVQVSVTSEANASASTLGNPQNACNTNEIMPEPKEPKLEKAPDRCQSTRSLADCISTAEEEEWTALEGVTRVNSLLNLPRFLVSDDKSPNRKTPKWKKWL